MSDGAGVFSIAMSDETSFFAIVKADGTSVVVVTMSDKACIVAVAVSDWTGLSPSSCQTGVRSCIQNPTCSNWMELTLGAGVKMKNN